LRSFEYRNFAAQYIRVAYEKFRIKPKFAGQLFGGRIVVLGVLGVAAVADVVYSALVTLPTSEVTTSSVIDSPVLSVVVAVVTSDVEVDAKRRNVMSMYLFVYTAVAFW
jgi:hypothetical protein